MHRGTERVEGFYAKMKETARLDVPHFMSADWVGVNERGTRRKRGSRKRSAHNIRSAGLGRDSARSPITVAYFFFFVPVSSGVAPGILKSQTE
jgi:hypothetical protein